MAIRMRKRASKAAAAAAAAPTDSTTDPSSQKGESPNTSAIINDDDDDDNDNGKDKDGKMDALRRQPLWIVLAVSSGACAALNGVFAKLTTTAVTSHLSAGIASLLGLAADSRLVDVAVRGFFFGMNLLFNAAMWALFTAALTKGDSTTRVSIVNVSANFVITALLGWLLFAESLPVLWFLGAAFLAVGNVIIGRATGKDDDGDGKAGCQAAENEHVDEREHGYRDVEAEGEVEGADGQALLSKPGHDDQGSLIELDGTVIHTTDPTGPTDRSEQSRLRQGEDVDAPL